VQFYKQYTEKHYANIQLALGQNQYAWGIFSGSRFKTRENHWYYWQEWKKKVGRGISEHRECFDL